MSLDHETKMSLLANQYGWEYLRYDDNLKKIKDYLHDAYCAGFLKGEEIARKRGWWYKRMHVTDYMYCSNCNYMLSGEKTQFCPGCGAKMDLDKQTDNQNIHAGQDCFNCSNSFVDDDDRLHCMADGHDHSAIVEDDYWCSDWT